MPVGVNLKLQILLFFILVISAPSLGIRFLLAPGKHKCLHDEVHKDVLVTGKYEASAAPLQQTDIFIKDAKGQTLYRKDHITSGNFAFTTEDYEIFEICFRSGATGGNVEPREIFLDIKRGSEAKAFDAMEKAAKLKPLEVELKRLEEVSDDIVRDFVEMHNKAEQIRSTNESTHRRVLYFSILSMVILVGFACWQLIYLRRYFKSKKLIE